MDAAEIANLKTRLAELESQRRIRVAGLKGFLHWLEGQKKTLPYEVRARLLAHAIVTDEDYREATR